MVKVGYFKTWKEVMFKPMDFFAKLPKKEKYAAGSKFFLKTYALMLLIIGVLAFLIFGIIFSVMGLIGSGNVFGLIFGTAGMVMVVLGILIGLPVILLMSWLMLFAGAGIIHLFVLLLGGKQGYVETFKVLAYSTAPALFGFIPLIGHAAAIYSIILQVFGIHKRHKMSMGRAVAVILLPLAILFVLFIIGYMVFIVSLIATRGFN